MITRLTALALALSAATPAWATTYGYLKFENLTTGETAAVWDDVDIAHFHLASGAPSDVAQWMLDGDPVGVTATTWESDGEDGCIETEAQGVVEDVVLTSEDENVYVQAALGPTAAQEVSHSFLCYDLTKSQVSSY